MSLAARSLPALSLPALSLPARVLLAAAVLVSACGSDTTEPGAGTLPEVSGPASTAAPTPVSTPAPTPEPTSGTEPVPSTEPSPPTSDAAAALAAARQLWIDAGIDAYEWETVTFCFCPEIDPVTTRVLGGRVLGDPDDYFLVSVEDLFERLAADLANGGEIEATYDPELGYPTHVDADPLPEAVDDEYVFDASALVVVDDPIGRWFTETYPCGYGFQVGTPDQVAGLFVQTPEEPGTFDVAALGAELRFGTDLFANWCDDVLEPGEPNPIVVETWSAASGALAVSVEPGGLAVGQYADLVMTTRDGSELSLGDAEVSNALWGGAAG